MVPDGAAGPSPAMRDPDGRWAALAFLAVAIVLSMTTWFSASAVLPELRAQWGLSTQESSWLTISVQLGFVIGALVSALLWVWWPLLRLQDSSLSVPAYL